MIVGADPIATNEAMLKGLDYILDVAHLNQMRVILVLTDYMSDRAGGPLQYLQ